MQKQNCRPVLRLWGCNPIKIECKTAPLILSRQLAVLSIKLFSASRHLNFYLTYICTFQISVKKFFVITFLGSIIWIAVYSYLMVWWATVAGKVIGIPDTVS